MIVQTKCGIRPFGYDFSCSHILKQVDDSLKRLNMDYLDVLLLHRPDALMEPDEVAAVSYTQLGVYKRQGQNCGKIFLLL